MSTTTEKWTIFGERLKTELERQEMSLRQFAEKAGLTLTTACRYVHSQRTPRATEILKAAKVLGVTCDYMLGLSDDPHKTRDGWAKAGFHELPSAQPERKKGEWIDYTEDGYVECPFCHSATNCDGNKNELHFCFSCGADMREPEDIPMEYFESGGR